MTMTIMATKKMRVRLALQVTEEGSVAAAATALLGY